MPIVIANKGLGGKATFTSTGGGGMFRMKYSVLPLLLDTYTGAAAAYSLRKLRTAYTGAAIRVRRSSDETTTDIGFTSSGALDEAALLAFVGAGSGFVSIWYDQSGNARDATQGVVERQPRIVNAGVIDRLGSKPTLFFDGVNDCLERTDTGLPTGLMTSTSVSYYNVATIAKNTFKHIYHYGSAIIGGSVFVAYGSNSDYGINSIGLSQYGDAVGVQNRTQKNNLLFLTKPATTGITYLYVNNTLTNSKSMITNTTLRNTAAGFRIGQANDGYSGFFMSGFIQEINIWGTDYTASRTDIEINTNAYYTIY